MATAGGPILQRETDSYGEWVKIFRHNVADGALFSDANDWAEAKQTNTGFPDGDKYSILEGWGHFLRNGKFTLKLDYPNNSKTNIWSQTNNPVFEDGTGGVTGYTAISIDESGNLWGGLERYDANSSTFLDGSVNHANWWYAVGSRSAYGGSYTIPGPSTTTNLVELWILDKPA